ncbi:MAG: hypothetical protein ACK2UH_13495, partial [Candidatus Promineifilaceae bacterium]
PSLIAPMALGYSLVGRIGTSPGFDVGASLCTKARASGRLYLAFNDDKFSNNGGSFTVNIKTGP